jgi:hypothetical protein
MIGGFIITGNASKTVLMRGMGPSLADANVPEATLLKDPVLELHNSDGSLITSNDNWKDSPQRSQIEGTIFEPPDDREAVILAELQPGPYTAVLSGKDQTSGVGLVEIYDLNQAADSALGNISTRGFVQAGDNVMIGGFTLGGDPNNTRIALRGKGPSLARFGFANVLPDPTLELRDANGTLLVSNDNWTDDPVSAAQLALNGLALDNSHESGIFVSLPPGQFTVILAGKDGGVGIGLVEIFNLK